jgi:hypothetical protein
MVLKGAIVLFRHVAFILTFYHEKLVMSTADRAKDIPITMNNAPAIFEIRRRSIFPDMNLPRYIARMDSRAKPVMTPIKTCQGLYSTAKSAAAIWVLSPHSDRKIMVNPA